MDFPIEASAELVAFCTDWHNGQASAMYSVCSTGAIHSADILRGLASELRVVWRDHWEDGTIYDDSGEQVSNCLYWVEALEQALPE